MTLTDVNLGDLIAQLEVLKPYNLGGVYVGKFQSLFMHWKGIFVNVSVQWKVLPRPPTRSGHTD